MVKLIAKIVAFSLLFLFILAMSEKFFIKKDRFNSANFLFNKASDTSNFDILFFGSSKSYCSYNPTIFKNELEINVFNLAGQGQVLPVTNFVMDQALKRVKPRLVVVDLSYDMIMFNRNDSIAEKAKSYQLKIFDNFRLSKNKIKHLNNIYNKKELIYISSPLIRNHNQWNYIFDQNYRYEYLEDKNNLFLFNNGYIGTLHQMQETGYIFANEMNKGYESLLKSNGFQVNEREIEIIMETKAIAKKHDIEVLFVSAPSIKGFVKHLSFYESLERLSKEIGFNYLNLNRHFNNINLGPDDFKDIQHMRFSGGYKTSLYLANYIKKNFEFPHKRKINNLDNNISHYLMNNLNGVDTILSKPFKFNETIKVDKIGYFNETENRYVFIFKLDKASNNKDLENFIGYIRYYNREINEVNKNVRSFPIKLLEVGNEKYIFARILVNDKSISKFDIFFFTKGNDKRIQIIYD